MLGDRGNSAKEGLIVDESSTAVPLVKAYDPPSAPPQVELVHWRDGQAAVVQRGVRYAGEWIVDGKLARAPEPLPVPWPATGRSRRGRPPLRELRAGPGAVSHAGAGLRGGARRRRDPHPRGTLTEFECALRCRRRCAPAACFVSRRRNGANAVTAA